MGNIVPNGYLTGEEYTRITSWKKYKEYFSENVPAQKVIADNYIKTRNYYENLAKKFPEVLKFIEDENFEEESPYRGIEIVINGIQKDGNLWRFVEKDEKGMEISQEDAKKVLEGWNKIIDQAKAEKWSGTETQISRLRSMCDSLNKAIEKGSNYIKLGDITGQGDNAKSSSIALSVQGTLNAIRGAVLEQKVKEFLRLKLPTDYKTYQTGAITVGGKSIKEDLMILLDGLELTNSDGKAIYKFENGDIKTLDNKTAETVSLTVEQLTKLQDSGFGISAKTTKGKITFHGGYNIRTLLEDSLKEGADKSYIYQLIHQYQLGISHKASIYQNYAVSTLATKIIGEKNIFLAGREKIIPTYKYIEDKVIANNNFLVFKNQAIPRRSDHNIYIENFGSTDIIGPRI